MIQFIIYYQIYEAWTLLPLCAVTQIFCGHDLDIKVERSTQAADSN